MSFGEEFAKKQAMELRHFLFAARSSVSWGQKIPISFHDGAHGLGCEHSDGWKYRDKWYGGEPFSGITTIAYNKRVCWVMTYWGSVAPDIDKEVVYNCLRPALAEVSIEAPWRGPKLFEADNCMDYRNSWEGDIMRFEGHEEIVDVTEHVLYSAKYLGGFVDLT